MLFRNKITFSNTENTRKIINPENFTEYIEYYQCLSHNNENAKYLY